MGRMCVTWHMHVFCLCEECKAYVWPHMCPLLRAYSMGRIQHIGRTVRMYMVQAVCMMSWGVCAWVGSAWIVHCVCLSVEYG